MKVDQLFRYSGSKAKILKSYYPYFRDLRPQYTVDYFAGSGSVSTWFHQLYPGINLYLNELDTHFTNMFTATQNSFEEFRKDLEDIERVSQGWYGYEAKKELYKLVQDQYNEQYDYWYKCSMPRILKERNWQRITTANSTFEHALFYFLRVHSFSGVNRRSKKTGKYISSPGIRGKNTKTYKPKVLQDFKAMLDHATILNMDYRQVQLELPRSLHYLDPPYLGTGPGIYADVTDFGWEETEEVCAFAYDLSKKNTVYLSNEDDAKLIDHMKFLGFEYARIPRSGTGKMAATKNSGKDYEALFYKIQPDILPQ
jgi:site-specific DNA-adenine methylase